MWVMPCMVYEILVRVMVMVVVMVKGARDRLLVLKQGPKVCHGGVCQRGRVAGSVRQEQSIIPVVRRV